MVLRIRFASKLPYLAIKKSSTESYSRTPLKNIRLTMSQAFPITLGAHRSNNEMACRPEPQHMSAQILAPPYFIHQTAGNIPGRQATGNKSGKNTISPKTHLLHFIYSRISMNTLGHAIDKQQFASNAMGTESLIHPCERNIHLSRVHHFLGTLCSQTFFSQKLGFTHAHLHSKNLQCAVHISNFCNTF